MADGRAGYSRDGVAPGRPLLTDGGKTSAANGSDGPEQADGEADRQLQRLFEELTDTSAVVDRQEPTSSTRYLDDSDAGISAYVTDAARADGLSDAIAPPEVTDQR